jgi:selenide, water dikinase
VIMPPEIPPEIEALLYDPQTSGGLLISLENGEAKKVLEQRPETYVIGRVIERRSKPIEVLL